MHLVSNVICDVRDEFDAFDLFGATFPAGTLSGAPKVRAMEIIAEQEDFSRGFYGGAVGRITSYNVCYTKLLRLLVRLYACSTSSLIAMQGRATPGV